MENTWDCPREGEKGANNIQLRTIKHRKNLPTKWSVGLLKSGRKESWVCGPNRLSQ